MSSDGNSYSGLEIAIIGMAGRFPNSPDLKTFWQNLRDGVECISFFTGPELAAAGIDEEMYSAPNYVKARGVLPDIEYFDASFFGFIPAEAEVMDPQARILHECAWEALEDAGYDPNSSKGRIGIYAGASSHMPWEVLTLTSGKSNVLGYFNSWHLFDKDFMSSRIAYNLNLSGPGITLHTACSTSLVAVHLACQGILSGECRMALAGGVTAAIPGKQGYMYQEGMIASPDGHCRTFDSNAGGTVFSDGVGVVVLKLLERAMADRDHIYAVIKGSAINNDGKGKVGFTAPSVKGQAAVIRNAMRMAGVEPESITYIESHGTATNLGDPAEIEGLRQAFKTDKTGFCRIGSVKSNLGHTDVAAGVAGLIKTVLSLQHRMLPPSLHLLTPNPKLNLENTPFKVNTGLVKWEGNGSPLRAGVSSFGVGGTNVHVVLEEAPQAPQSSDSRPWQMLMCSGQSRNAAGSAMGNLSAFLVENPSVPLADAAYTMQTGRVHFEHRCVLVNKADKRPLKEELSAVLQGRAYHPRMVFMFSGQGSQYVNMGLDLYRSEPVYRQQLDRCLDILGNVMKMDVRAILFPGTGKSHENQPNEINQTRFTQPLLFAVEYAMAKLLMSWGIEPYAMTGHSIGEYVAACLSGVFGLEDVLDLVALRGKLMQDMPGGSMLSVVLPAQETEKLLAGQSGLSLAAVNSPGQCVVSGTDQAIETFAGQLKHKGHQCRILHTSHAFHSAMMDPILPLFKAAAGKVTLNNPTIPYISNLSGDWITVEDALSPAYWARHLRRAVRFSDGLGRLMETPELLLIEVGPGKALSTFARQHPAKTAQHAIVQTMRHPRTQIDDQRFLLEALGRMWLAGASIDWKSFYGDEKRNRVSLPAYPFERLHFPIAGDPFKMGAEMMEKQKYASIARREDKSKWFYTPAWKRLPLPPPVPPSAEGDSAESTRRWLVFSDDSGLCSEVASYLKQAGLSVYTASAGAAFSSEGGGYVLDPDNEEHYERLLNELNSGQGQVSHIVHLWGLNTDSASESQLDSHLRRGYYSLLNIARALGKLGIDYPVNIAAGVADTQPAHATLLGPVKTIPREYRNIRCALVDTGGAASAGFRLWSECASGLPHQVVAYRGEHRLIQTLKPYPLQDPGGEEDSLNGLLKHKGVYLITGGLGGIGVTFAQYLASHYQARLVLAGRSPLPPHEEWEQWLSRHDGNDPVSLKITRLRRLESLGAEVLTGQADAADQSAMSALAKEALSRFGGIDGIIHAAGVADAGVIQVRSREISESVLRPKVHGALALDAIVEHQLKNNPPAFVLLCSSLASLIGPAGQVAYTSANAFLDAFALSKNSDVRWISINWDSWRQLGMAVQAVHNMMGNTAGGADAETSRSNTQFLEKEFQLIGHGLMPGEGIEVFQRVLGGAVPNRIKQMLVSTRDFPLLLEALALQEAGGEKEKEEEAASGPRRSRPELSRDYVEPATDIEKKLAAIWADFLGVKEVGIHDDFFELGGDSLKIMTLGARIHKAMDVDVPLAEFFNNPSISGIAHFVEGAGEVKYSAIGVLEKKEYYPLSPAQQRLYFMSRMAPDNTVYNLPEYFEVPAENFQRDRVETAFKKLIQRHETLRTGFVMVDDQPVQRIAETVPFEMSYFDLSQTGENLSRRKLEIHEAFIRPFDLEKAPLLRAGLMRVPGDKHICMVDMHHIISDGASLSILIEDLSALYDDRPLPALRIQYKEYAVWQHRLFEEKEGSIRQQEKYWLERFADAASIPRLELPEDYPRPGVFTFAGDHYPLVLKGEIATPFKRLGVDSGATLYMNILAALNVLFFKYTGQTDIIIGSGIAGRPHADLQPLLGMFVNTLVMRNHPHAELSYGELLKEVITGSVKAFENQDVQFEDLVDKLGLVRDPSRNPLFDISMLVQTFVEKGLEEEGRPRTLDFEYQNKATKSDITFYIYELAEDLLINMEYYTAIFKPQTMERLAGHLRNVVKAVAGNPDIKLKDIDLISDEEKQLVLEEFNRSERVREHEDRMTLHGLFQEVASHFPDRTAVIDAGAEGGGVSYNYRELDVRSNRVARQIRESLNEKYARVGVMMSNPLNLAAAIMGVLKAGAAYVPLDPSLPGQRMKYMTDDARIGILLSEEKYLSTVQRLQEQCESVGAFLCLDHTEVAGDEGPVEELAGVDTPAYIIYTSGTTGVPKGVVVEHGGVVNTLLFRKEEYGFDFETVALQLFSYSFDGFVTGFFTPLMAGGSVVMLSREELADTARIREAIVTYGVHHFICVPPLYSAILEDLSAEEMASLKTVTLAGDRLNPTLLETSRAKCSDLEIVNEYGITECSVLSTIYRHQEQDPIIKIGAPISNTRLYILDDQQRPLPIGVAGELHIAGTGLARGYLNNPELTNSKFHPPRSQRDTAAESPLERGGPRSGGVCRNRAGRLYKTGDLARWLPGGVIQFLGRITYQVKVRGFRIELQEIESRLAAHPSVKEAVVTDWRRENGETVLCAYVTLRDSHDELQVEELESHLSGFLPSYMIPSYFEVLDRLPLTAHGKIDRKALPLPNVDTLTDGPGSEAKSAPLDELESGLVRIWSEILDMEARHIGIDDNFFKVGGHSLRATLLVSRIRKRFDVQVPLAEVFRIPTLRGQARYIKRAGKTIYQTIRPVEKKEYYPASSAQKRLFFLDRFENIGTSYNISSVLELEGKISAENLQNALNSLTRRHEALRTSFIMVGDQPVQRVHDNASVTLQSETGPIGPIDPVLEEFIRPFDLSAAPLLRAGLFGMGPDRFLLILELHHIISDGTSMGIMIRDLTRLYAGESFDWPTIQYKDFSSWQNRMILSGEMDNQESYWMELYNDREGLPVLNIPTDFPRPESLSFEGASYRFSLGTEVSAAVNKLSSSRSATLYMNVLTALNVLFFKYTGQQDIIIGSGIMGRPHADLEPVIGMFVNSLALRNRPGPDKTYVDFLDEVKENSIKAFENQDLQFEVFVDKLGIPRDPSRNPLFDVLFVVQNFQTEAVNVEGVTFRAAGHETVTAKFDLTFFAFEQEGDILFNVEYATRLFKPATIEEIARHLREILEQACQNPMLTLAEFNISHRLAAVKTEDKSVYETGFDF